MYLLMNVPNQRTCEDNYSIEVLASFVNSIGEGACCWFYLPITGKKEENVTQDVFNNVSSMLG